MHRLSPEVLLRFSSATLRLRAPRETATSQLMTATYFFKGAAGFQFPNKRDVWLYGSDINAFTAPLPISLLNEIQRVQAEHGMGGIAFGQRISSDDPPRLKRRRRDHDLSDVEASSEDSESESGE